MKKPIEVMIDYIHQYDEYRIYELDGNQQTCCDEDEAIRIAQKIYGDDVIIKIKTCRWAN